MNHTFKAVDSQGEEHEYAVDAHPAGEGQQLFFELMAIAASGSRGLMGAADIKNLTADMELDEAMLGEAIGAVLGQLHKHDTKSIIMRLLRYTTRDGKPFAGTPYGKGSSKSVPFDSVYAANYGELVKVLTSVAKFNFGSFFDGLRAGRIA